MNCSVDMVGRQFGHLMVLERAKGRGPGPIWWVCRCLLCGRDIERRGINIRSVQKAGSNNSCGCRLEDPLDVAVPARPLTERLLEHNARSSERSPEEVLLDNEAAFGLRVCVRRLQGRRREVVLRYFWGRETLEEIASTWGVTRERVRQIEGSALKWLRVFLASKTCKNARFPRRRVRQRRRRGSVG